MANLGGFKVPVRYFNIIDSLGRAVLGMGRRDGTWERFERLKKGLSVLEEINGENAM